MDYDFQRKVPDITINIHVHDPDASRRFVLINMKKYIEGDTIRGGLVIDTITENGLLLEYNGEQFRILASEH